MALCVESVVITPNPVTAGGKIKIEVKLYDLYPALDLYPAEDLYPGEDLFGMFPADYIYPGNDEFPTEGGMME